MSAKSLNNLNLVFDCEKCKLEGEEDTERTIATADLRGYIGIQDRKLYARLPGCPKCNSVVIMAIPPGGLTSETNEGHLRRCLMSLIVREGRLQHRPGAEEDEITRDNEDAAAQVAEFRTFYTQKGDSVLTNEFDGVSSLNLRS